MGNVSIDIDLSIKNIWESWFAFRRRKKPTREIDEFTYRLEEELFELHDDLGSGTYRHGSYRTFVVRDNKRRTISVASIRDRVVHRLLYEYLLPIYDKTFIYDVWSCRPNKGLAQAIERTKRFVRKNPCASVWRADITKFFDHVNQATLMTILKRKIYDQKALWLLREVIQSVRPEQFERERERGSARPKNDIYQGIPIGNVTSQIFANIYLNELDRFVVHTVKPRHYLRYGDDFIVFDEHLHTLENIRHDITNFLSYRLGLVINPKHDIIVPVTEGLFFLGVEIYPTGRRLRIRTRHRIKNRLKPNNMSSYSGLIQQHENEKKQKEFHWRLMPFFDTP